MQPGTRVRMKPDHWTGAGSAHGTVQADYGDRLLVKFDDGTTVDVATQSVQPGGEMQQTRVIVDGARSSKDKQAIVAHDRIHVLERAGSRSRPSWVSYPLSALIDGRVDASTGRLELTGVDTFEALRGYLADPVFAPPRQRWAVRLEDTARSVGTPKSTLISAGAGTRNIDVYPGAAEGVFDKHADAARAVDFAKSRGFHVTGPVEYNRFSGSRTRRNPKGDASDLRYFESWRKQLRHIHPADVWAQESPGMWVKNDPNGDTKVLQKLDAGDWDIFIIHRDGRTTEIGTHRDLGISQRIADHTPRYAKHPQTGEATRRVRRNPGGTLDVINEETVLDAVLDKLPAQARGLLESVLGRRAMLEMVEEALVARLQVKVAAIRNEIMRGG